MSLSFFLNFFDECASVWLVLHTYSFFSLNMFDRRIPLEFIYKTPSININECFFKPCILYLLSTSWKFSEQNLKGRSRRKKKMKKKSEKAKRYKKRESM